MTDQAPPLALLPERIDLVAISSRLNVRRRYAIETSADLFGHVIVRLSWGRIGTYGRSRTLSFDQAPAAQRFILATLRRRASARQRIGVSYRLASASEATPRP